MRPRNRTPSPPRNAASTRAAAMASHAATPAPFAFAEPTAERLRFVAGSSKTRDPRGRGGGSHAATPAPFAFAEPTAERLGLSAVPSRTVDPGVAGVAAA